MSNTAHHDWQDSVMEWAHENAAELKHFTGHRALPRCTGACDQGRKDCACTTGHVVDRLPEAYDKPEPVTGREAVKVWAGLLLPALIAIGCGLLTWAWRTYVQVPT